MQFPNGFGLGTKHVTISTTFVEALFAGAGDAGLPEEGIRNKIASGGGIPCIFSSLGNVVFWIHCVTVYSCVNCLSRLFNAEHQSRVHLQSRCPVFLCVVLDGYYLSNLVSVRCVYKRNAFPEVSFFEVGLSLVTQNGM